MKPFNRALKPPTLLEQIINGRLFIFNVGFKPDTSHIQEMNIDSIKLTGRVVDVRHHSATFSYDYTFEVDDVLSPPAARAAWLEEKGQ